MDIDPRRTVVATVIQQEEWDDTGTPGACLDKSGDANFPHSLLFYCPGCGRFGSIPAENPKPDKSPSWKIVSGVLSDATTLTLEPSIHCVGCCGWHGYLRNGVFRSC